jgi:hypothetical protein
MKFRINFPVKPKDKIYTLDEYRCSIEEYYVEKIMFSEDIKSPTADISYKVVLLLERYKDGTNSYKVEKKLAQCFLSKQDLINKLNK